MTIADSLTLLNSTKTAIKTAIEAQGVTVGAVPFADYPDKIALIEGGGGSGPLEWSQEYYDAIYAAGPGSWSRPEWRALPAMAETDQAFYGLHAVYPEDGNFCSLTASGDYTVDWGDGVVENFAANVQANHEYSYANADLAGTDAPVTFTSATSTVNRTAHGFANGKTVTFWNIATTTGIVDGQVYYVVNRTADTFQVSATAGGAALTLTNDGTASLSRYKQAIVTVTPQANFIFATLSLNVKHPQTGLQLYSAGWLDILVGSPNFFTTGLVIGQSGTTETVRKNSIERVRVVNLGNTNTLENRFRNLRELVVIELPSTAAVTNMGSMFNGCSSLQTIPLFNTQAATSMTSMFVSCSSLQTVPLFNTAAVTAMGNMFSSCPSLQTVPMFNTAAVTNMTGMFSNCSSLRSIPLFNTAAVTNMAGMFNACPSLQTVPLLNTQAVMAMGTMFQSCTSLQTVPMFNTAAVTDMTSMFSSCSSLQMVPLFNTAKVTSMAGMFSSCPSLQTVPLFDTVAVTTMTSMFQNCSALQTVPLFNTQAVTSMGNMFQSCSSLQTVPLFDTAEVTTMNNMFSGCLSLQTVPLFDTSAGTNMNSMFSSCSSLQNIPAFTTTAVSTSGNLSSIFTNCASLARIQAKDFRFTFSVASCKLSAAALNEIYTNLPTVTGQTITVTGNYGVTGDDPTIATAKGWTVTG